MALSPQKDFSQLKVLTEKRLHEKKNQKFERKKKYSYTIEV